MKLKLCIPFLIVTIIAGCLEVDSDSSKTFQQDVNKSYTALLATNTSDNNTTPEAESVGSLPQPKMQNRISNNGTIDFSKHVIKGNPTLPQLRLPLNANSTSITKRNYAPQMKLTHETLTHTFTAYDSSNRAYSLNATKVYGTATSKCLIYLENGSSFSSFNFSELGKFFDETVYPKVREGFAINTDVDENDKVVILYYDMSSSTILGFFYSLDLYSQASIDAAYGAGRYNSNEMELFYMNTGWPEAYNLDPDTGEMKRTLAHEFQHMSNFGHRVIDSGQDALDTWIDEGLAESSEHYVLGTPGTSRIDWFNRDGYKKLRNGLPLIVWEGEFGNYSLVYTFMQYARIQSGLGESIYKKVVDSPYSDYRAISEILIENNSEFDNFKEILKSYRLANLLQQKSGVFGYKDEYTTFDLEVQNPTTSISNIKLYPSGSIAIQDTWGTINAASGSGKGSNIELSKVLNGYVEEF